MNASAYLHNYASLIDALGTIDEQAERYRAACESLRKPDGGRTTLDEACAEHVDFAEAVKTLKDVLNCRAASIRHTVSMLPNPYRTIIWLRYIRGFSWARICAITKYSRQHVHRLHGHALQLVDDLLKTIA